MHAKYTAVALICVVASGCIHDAQPLVGTAISPTAAMDACAEIGITPPDTTAYHLLHRVQGIDAAIWVKMSMPPDDAADFLTRRPFETADWSGESNYIQGDAAWPGWNASRSQKFRTAHIQLPNAEYLNVVVDEDDSSVTKIYLMWHET